MLVGALLLGAAGAFAGCLEPLFLRHLLDLVLRAHPGGSWQLVMRRQAFRQALLTILLLAGVGLLQQAMQTGLALASNRVRFGVSAALARRVVGRYYEQSLGFHQANGAGYLMTRVDRGVGATGELLGGTLLTLVPNLANLALMLAIMFRLSAPLAAVALPLLLLFLATTYWGARNQVRHETAVQEGWSRIYGRVSEMLAAIKTVKSLHAETAELERYCQASEGLFRRLWRMVLAGAAYDNLKNVLALAARMAVLFFGIMAVMEGRLTPGTWIAMVGYAGMIFGPLAGLTGAYDNSRKSLVAAGAMMEFLNHPVAPAVAAAADKLAADNATKRPTIEVAEAAPAMNTRLRGEIEFRNVSFAYPANYAENVDETAEEAAGGRRVLEQVSFRVQPGETAALMGRSGGGKTTILDLLLGLYAPQSGEILLDGRELRSWPRERLRQSVALVLQEPVLFAGSVAENLSFGLTEVSPERMQWAARAAQADEFIRQMPHGYETVLGERGARLSGGQRQRLAIARALLRDPAVLLLDEPSSQLDTGNAEALFQAMRRLMQGRTSLVATHRPVDALDPDIIFRLERGRLRRIAAAKPAPAELAMAAGREEMI